MSPTHDFDNIGDVLDFDIVKGAIVSVDDSEDTCVVSVAGRNLDALLFYHCEPGSVLRDNGAIEGAASGFSAGDEVIVMVKKDGKVVKVVGHMDGVKPCETAIVLFTVSVRGEALCVLWDARENRPRTLGDGGAIIPSDDAALIEWKVGKKDKSVSWLRATDDFAYIQTGVEGERLLDQEFVVNEGWSQTGVTWGGWPYQGWQYPVVYLNAIAISYYDDVGWGGWSETEADKYAREEIRPNYPDNEYPPPWHDPAWDNRILYSVIVGPGYYWYYRSDIIYHSWGDTFGPITSAETEDVREGWVGRGTGTNYVDWWLPFVSGDAFRRKEVIPTLTGLAAAKSDSVIARAIIVPVWINDEMSQNGARRKGEFPPGPKRERRDWRTWQDGPDIAVSALVHYDQGLKQFSPFLEGYNWEAKASRNFQLEQLLGDAAVSLYAGYGAVEDESVPAVKVSIEIF